MGVKGDFKAANPASNGNVTTAKKDISVDAAPKRDYKDDVIEDLNSDLKKLQKSLTCVICLEMLFEPYTLQCGHVFCYTCVLDWLDQDKRMTCPECRSVVKVKPAPAYLIRDMIEVFVLRAELTSPNGNGLELRKQQKEALKAVEKDKATEGNRGGLFRGLFRAKKKHPRVVRDPEDGVLRCPGCNWEIEDGYRHRTCEHCGDRFRPLSRHGDFSDDDDDDDEDDDDDDDGDDDEDDSGLETDTDSERLHPQFESSSEEDEAGWNGDHGIHGVELRMFNRNRLRNQFDNGEEEEDYAVRMRDSSESTTGGRDEPIILEDGSDTDEATRNVQRPPRIIPQARQRNRRGASNHEETSEDEGSLADFIEHDTPEVRRGRPVPGRNGAGARGFFSNSPVVISSSPAIIAPTRRNNRRTVIDDEEEDNQSSVSEASSIHPRRDYSQRRGPIALTSDNDDYDDLEPLGHNMGYAPLDYTASENEDDSFVSPSSAGEHTNIANHNSGPGSVFSVPEEDEEDEEDEESRVFGDDDESEDQDGDVRMGGDGQRSGVSSSQRAVRNRTRSTRPHVIEDDSESDSDAPTTRRRRIQATGTRGNYLRTSHRDSNSSRRPREIDPAFLNMFQQHSQAITEGRLESLGSMNSSVSPARSATPVQRNYTGGSSSRAARSTRESTRESRESTRELTPVQAMGQSSPPPPFSPMFQGISSSLAPNSPAPSTPAPNNSQTQSPRLGGGGEGGSNNQTSLQSPRTVPITIGASPQASRMRTRNSRQQLRGASSRSGLRLGSATTTPNISQSAQLQGITSTAATNGRQQGTRPILTAAASRGRRGIPLTTEDIRARGEAMLRQRQEAAAESANGLGRRSSRRNLSSSTANGNGSSAPAPLVTVGRIGSSTLQGNGRRVGAVIGGAPGQNAGGGPMLIIENGDE